jgi:hypothetical protein
VALGSGRGTAHCRGNGADTGGRGAAGEAEELPEEEEERRRSGVLRWKCKNLRDFTENRNFPLIQSPNEEKVKIEVVELFKSYNFALGLKFRNLKYKVLFHKFCPNNGNLINFWAYLQAFKAGHDDIHLFHFDPW